MTNAAKILKAVLPGLCFLTFARRLCRFITLRVRSGGSLCFSCHDSWQAPQDRTELLGAAGRTISNEDAINLQYIVGDQPKLAHIPRFCTAGGDSLKETGFLRELEAFVAHLRGERKLKDIPSRIEEAA